ncbi:MAG: efflux RND transporter permease subunit [Alphaproteobacteria bacterium]|jgi:multidrug efflux pump|nr:efflux RND transporter permease subunit [Alphaproteobacteria bacterium]
MALIDHAIDRARVVLAVLVLLLLAGAYAYASIAKESDPDINIPIIYTSLHLEGISPADAERLLVRPMERELTTVEGVDEMRSTAYQGGGNVLLEFQAGFDADTAMADVREAVDKAKAELPAEADEPSVNEVNPSLQPVLVVTLSGPMPERALLDLARDLQDRIEAIPSVLEAQIDGDREEVVEVIVSPQLVESYGLEGNDLIGLFSRSNRLVAAGRLESPAGGFAVEVPGLFETPADILAMPLLVEGDSAVTVADIAKVRPTFKDPQSFARMNGQRAIGLQVVKRTGENILSTIAAVRATVEAERAFWPPGVEVTYTQDESENIRTMLSDLQNNTISAILLVMVVLLLALGLRPAGLVGVAVPGALLSGILLLYLAGLTVNVVVLFALILSVGMLVDGAIVVTEYADREMAAGAARRTAYAAASRRMAWPIIASTATTLAAFFPLLFWPDVVGEFMKYLPLTLIAVLTASLAMALVFVPTLGVFVGGAGQRLPQKQEPGLNHKATSLLSIARSVPWLPLIASAGLFTLIMASFWGLMWAVYWASWLFGFDLQWISEAAAQPGKAAALGFGATSLLAILGLLVWYTRALRAALARPFLVLGATLALLVGTWGAYILFGNGVEFFPDIEPETATILVHARGNLSVWEKDALTKKVEAKVLETSGIEAVYTRAGTQPRGGRGDLSEDVIGQILIQFEDWRERPPASEILEGIRKATTNISGIQVETREQQGGPPRGKDVQVELSSRFPERLPAMVTLILRAMGEIGGFRDIEDSRPLPGIEWEMTVDRAQAAKFGLDVATIGAYVRMVTNGLIVGTYRPESADDEVDITLRYDAADRSLAALERIKIPTPAGPVPISSFVAKQPEPATGTINRVDQKRVLTVQADLEPGLNTADKVSALRAWLAEHSADIDPQVAVSFRGEDEQQAESQQFLIEAFTVALALMALILVSQFNSFSSAFLILTAVVMSTIGVMLGLLITGQPFGVIMSGVGVIALAGIVVNNNIVLIDTFDVLRREAPPGTPVRDIVMETGAQRLRPVLLTTVTTVIGLLPMVLQVNIDFLGRDITIGAPSTQWWVQLSTAIVFGLTFSTALTLIVTPCALLARARAAAWVRARLAPFLQKGA